MNKLIIPSIFAAISLAGCDNAESPLSPDTTDQQTRGGSVLTPATEATLSAWFHKAYETEADSTQHQNDGLIVADSEANGADAPLASASMESYDASSSSSTTLQEAGVDEADRVKLHTQHNFLYALYAEENYNGISSSTTDSADISEPASPHNFEAGLRVFKLNSNGSADEVQRVPTVEQSDTLRGIYLFEDLEKLVTVGSANNYIWDYWFYPHHFSNQKTRLQLFNVLNNGELDTSTTTMSFDGTLVSSRSVDDMIYLVLRHYPDFPTLYPHDTAEDDSADTPSAGEFLPTYQIGSAASETLVAPDSCYLNTDNATTRADIITLVAIDVSNATPAINSTCFVGATEAVYASTKALYLATTNWDYGIENGSASYSDPKIETDIHKFAFSDAAFNYRGSASVQGHLGYDQNRKSFRLNESGEYLRVISYNEQRSWIALPEPAVEIAPAVADEPVATTATNDTTNTEADSPVMLTILKQSSSGNALETISTLPNSARNAPLGKPGENLYATRFIGDRAYLVTFRVTDPLYALDLSDPTDPYIAGELEIEGYSDYLYPIGENLLLGIGKDAVAASSSFDDRPGAWYQGVKLSLIDATDPANLSEIDKIVIGKRGTETSALQDHHAYTQRNLQNGKVQVALPVSMHNTRGSYFRDEPSDFYEYTHTALYRYEIDPANKTINSIAPMVIAERDGSEYQYDSTWNDRSRIVGDHVYYLHSDELWSQSWDGTGSLYGPE